MMSYERQQPPFADVKEATLTWALAEGYVESAGAFWQVATAMGLDIASGTSSYANEHKFRGQVNRALDTLALVTRELVKVPARHVGPGGGQRQDYNRYYTPAKFKEAEAEELARQARAADRRARWAAVWDALVARGIEPDTTWGRGRGYRPTIGLDDYEKVLGI